MSEETRKELWKDQQKTAAANRRRILGILRGDLAAAQATRDAWEPVTDWIVERRYSK